MRLSRRRLTATAASTVARTTDQNASRVGQTPRCICCCVLRGRGCRPTFYRRNGPSCRSVYDLRQTTPAAPCQTPPPAVVVAGIDTFSYTCPAKPLLCCNTSTKAGRTQRTMSLLCMVVCVFTILNIKKNDINYYFTFRTDGAPRCLCSCACSTPNHALSPIAESLPCS